MEISDWGKIFDALYGMGGGLGAFLVGLFILKYFGFLQLQRNNRKTESANPVTSCPLIPDLKTVEVRLETMIGAIQGLREEQIRGNTWLELLATQAIPGAAEKHARRTKEKIRERSGKPPPATNNIGTREVP